MEVAERDKVKELAGELAANVSQSAIEANKFERIIRTKLRPLLEAAE